MTKKKGEFTVLRNIRAGMVIILLIYIGLIFQSKGDSDTPFADVQKAVVDAADDKNMTLAGTQEIKRFYGINPKELVWVKRFLKPKKLRVKLHFGFEDPYHTGQVLALCGMFYAFIGENMDLEPDFEKRVLEGSVYVKGRLRTVHMAVFAAKMLLDKNIRSTYHDIREFKW